MARCTAETGGWCDTCSAKNFASLSAKDTRHWTATLEDRERPREYDGTSWVSHRMGLYGFCGGGVSVVRSRGRRKAYLVELQQLVALVAEVPCAHREEALYRIFRGCKAADDSDQVCRLLMQALRADQRTLKAYLRMRGGAATGIPEASRGGRRLRAWAI